MKEALRLLNQHIDALTELDSAANRNLCDSGTGTCRLKIAANKASPAVNAAVELLRKERKKHLPEQL